MTVSPAIALNQSDSGSKERTKKPYFALNGPELVHLSINSICDRIKAALLDIFLKDPRLASEIHAFPAAQVTIQFEVLMSPHGEGRKIRIIDSIFVENTDSIPPDAIRIMNDMPILVEEDPKNANLLPQVGKVDVPKMANSVDPNLKQLVEKKFEGQDPFKAESGALEVEIVEPNNPLKGLTKK